MGGKREKHWTEMYNYISRFPTCYLLLNYSNSGRGTEGTLMLCFFPFGFACQKVYRDITFSPRSIREQANSS